MSKFTLMNKNKKLDDFINEVAEIFKNNKLLTQERITKITQQI